MRTCFPNPAKIIIVAIAAIFSCTSPVPVAPTEPVSGNCIGAVMDANGFPVKGASVLLVPGQYAPGGTGTSQQIDSTVSNSDGRFGFTVSEPGTYNLLASGNNRYAMRKAIRLGGTTTVELTAQVLAEPGSIDGCINLQGLADHHSAIILLIGTNQFATPSDSSGRFSVETLAPGQYTLRIIAMEKGYARAETTITITSAAATRLPVIELSKETTRVVTGFSADYYPPDMSATLHWKLFDTAFVSFYRIYCNREMNLEPVAMLADTCSSLTLDLSAIEFDTLIYQIAIVDTNGVENPPMVAEGVTNVIDFQKTITFQSMSDNCSNHPEDDARYHFDRNGNIYELTEKLIVKMDQNGHMLISYRIPDSVDAYFDCSQDLQSDSMGNIYAVRDSAIPPSFTYYSDIDLLRFDKNFNITAAMPLRDGLDSLIDNWFDTYAVAENGAIYTFTSRLDSLTHISKYGPDFVKLFERCIGGGDYGAFHILINNDTILCQGGSSTDNLRYFDIDLNPILTTSVHAMTNKDMPLVNFVCPFGIFVVPNCNYVTMRNRLFFYNPIQMKLLARFNLRDDMTPAKIYFDYSGNMYTLKRESFVTRPPVTIDKYSYKKLLQ